MRITGDEPLSSSGNGGTHTTNNNNTTTNNINNNNTISASSANSGSQYALCALGVGLIALGIIMIVWSVVPLDNSGPDGGDDMGDRKSKASSVAFILTGSGVAMLLLSLCLGMRNRRREQQRLLEIQNQRAEARDQQNRQTAGELAQRFDVPSYEEAVGSGQYPLGLGNPLPSASQLPSYDDLIQVDGVDSVEYENEAPVSPSQPAPPPTANAATSNRRPGKNSRKLLPIKIRRIKSEKLRVKNAANSQPAAGMSLEPLTPPPQYDDELPPL
ncbi:transmembrane protein 51a [Gouania willdenowi]|uniref:Transmembrane protein 51-like n=1 Tax=Gouania willdenowi TaxID=441366 RepID=A0A8C5DER2_GOUWI|nr:transmembrane protein 51-like [Gouania willdenowi]